METDASGLAIGAEEGKPIAFFSEKLNEARKSLSSSDKDKRCMHWCLKHWRHYQLPKEFVVYTARRFLQTQDKLGARHARWVAYLQSLTFKHKTGSRNVVANALSRREILLQTVFPFCQEFESVRNREDEDFECQVGCSVLF